MKITLIINNRPVEVEAALDEVLADTLRRYGYASVRKGCDTGNCGLCTVWVEDKPVLS